MKHQIIHQYVSVVQDSKVNSTGEQQPPPTVSAVMEVDIQKIMPQSSHACMALRGGLPAGRKEERKEFH